MKYSQRSCLAAALLAAGLLGGCRNASVPAGSTPMSSVDMSLGGRTFTLEVASTEEQRQRGLKYRDSLSAGAGMLFRMDEVGRHPISLRLVRIPLDVLWIAPEGRIVQVETMQPYEERSRINREPALFVVELNAGVARELGIKPGDPVTIPEQAFYLATTTPMDIKGKPFTLEMAVTPAEEEQGLMYRNAMARDHGMIFIMEEPGIHPFWMHNTRIPLDLLWLSADGEVVHVETMQPFDDNERQNSRPAIYVIELNAGMARELGIKEGDRLSLPEKVLKVARRGTEK